MNETPYLVTPYTFKEKLYLIKMYVTNGNTLELSVTDKHTAEEWRSNFDVTYIENLTHKTGNYKQFDVFVTMLKSGILKTSECVSLDLLTVEDLEILRSRKVTGKTSQGPPRTAQTGIGNTGNRRYLILTYSVEFDRIHYPLPLEYCGPPDPQILQGIIRKLEAEVERLQDQLNSPERIQQDNRGEITKLRNRVEELSMENKTLVDEIRQLHKKLAKRVNSYEQMENMQAVMKAIEEQVIRERTSFQRLVQKLRDEKSRLQQQVRRRGDHLNCRFPIRTSTSNAVAVDQLRVTERSLRDRLRCSGRQVPRGGSPASRRPGDGLSPRSAAPAPHREPVSPHASASRRVRSGARLHRAAGSPSALPRIPGSLHNPQPLVHTRSAACCHTFLKPHRSSSESSCCSQKRSTTFLKSKRGVSSNNVLKNSMQLERKMKQLEGPAVGLRNQKNKIVISPKHHRSCSEYSSSSHPHSNIKGNRSGSHSSESSRAGRAGSGDRRRGRKTKKKQQWKQNKDVQRGMSDLEDRIKALQKLLKEGLPMK